MEVAEVVEGRGGVEEVEVEGVEIRVGLVWGCGGGVVASLC